MYLLYKFYNYHSIKKNDISLNHFSYIKSSPFLIYYINLIILNNMRILDVGSGLGEFMILLKIILFEKYKKNIEIYGLEIDKSAINYVKIPTIFINAFDYKDYLQYDLIYLYQPLKNNDEMLKLLIHIKNINKHIIYNNNSVQSKELLELGFAQLSNTLWYSK